MRFLFALILMSLVITSCSRPPSQIKPTHAVGQPYSYASCEELVIERQAYMDRLEESKKIQSQRAAGDVVLGLGFGLIGLAVGKTAAGQDEEVNIGNYRGALIEIDTESKRKECVDPIFFTAEPLPPPKKEIGDDKI
ncbi:MAG: hypothetical protein GY750_15360 [Lentisphaerae bacterium]|nr:hypothetical protein [Lentisphaerota bacterium]